MFDTEDHLLAAFDSALAHSELWLSVPGRCTFTMEEVEGIHGRVDRMMVSLPAGVRPAKARSKLLQQETCCRIIIALKAKQPKSVDRLAIEIGRSRETVRDWLVQMEQEGLVRAVSATSYLLGPKSNLPDCEIWCFEGKLRDWKRALYQATRYRAFANRSFVVMPEQYIRPAEAQVDRFRLSRIGLLALDATGELRILTIPRSKQPRSPVMFAMAKGRVLSRMA